MTKPQACQLRSQLALLYQLRRETKRLQFQLTAREERLECDISRSLNILTPKLDETIRSTASRGHWEELLFCTHDIYLISRLVLPKTVLSDIGAVGLKPLYGYNSRLSSHLHDFLIGMFQMLRLLLETYDQHEVVFSLLVDIGLADVGHISNIVWPEKKMMKRSSRRAGSRGLCDFFGLGLVMNR